MMLLFLISAGHGEALFAQNLDSLRSTLESFFVQSIKQRNKIKETLNKYGANSEEFKILNQEIAQTDSIVLQEVKKIISKNGWLGRDQVGETANEELFLAIQHSKLATMEKFYGLLESSAKNGQSSKLDMAKMRDRILVLKNLPQIYGTQYYWDPTSSQYYFHAMDDFHAVDNRRKSIGLPRLKKYAKKNDISFKR